MVDQNIAKPRTIALICARGGSKGVPRKNIKLLAGRPLIGYAIELALKSDLVSRVVVSTEDQEIAQIAQSFGAEVPFMRPSRLAQDDSPEWLVWRHAIEELTRGGDQFDTLLTIPTTSPLRSLVDIEACLRLLSTSDADLVLTVTPAARNPYYNMVALDSEGYARVVIPSEGRHSRRQEAPEVFDITTVAYATRPEFVLQNAGLFAGKTKAVVVPRERALDIDSPLDFEFAEFLVNKSKRQCSS